MFVRQIRKYSSNTKSVERAFTERLKQLEGEFEESDSLNFKSLIDKDPQLDSLSKDLSQKEFEQKHQHAINFAKVPSYAGKQAKEIALSQPWTENENASDSILRMLVDKYRPSKVKPDMKKLANAKATVLEYTIEKNNPKVDAADSKFKEIYMEKFTPIGSFDKIKTIADSRIEESMKKGEFKNIDRNQKLNHEIGVFVDRTEHHLNNILKNQNITPPWIEKQGGVNAEINAFRNELRKKWETHIVTFYLDDHKNMQKEFMTKQSAIYDKKIHLTNNSIRTYNLQAPLSTQKLYLVKQKEFERCFDQVDVQQLRRREAKAREVPKVEPVRETSGFSLKFWKW